MFTTKWYVHVRTCKRTSTTGDFVSENMSLLILAESPP